MASREEYKKTIVDYLKDEKVKRIVLTGAAGVGKTWIANEIRHLCSDGSQAGLSYTPIWVPLNQRGDYSKPNLLRRYLYEIIARELSRNSTAEELDDTASKEEDEPKEESLDLMKDRISALAAAKLQPMKSDENKFLLILDGVPDTLDEAPIMTELEALRKPSFMAMGTALFNKVLITRRSKEVVTKEVGETKEMIVKKANDTKPLPDQEEKAKNITAADQTPATEKANDTKPLSDEERKVIEIQPLSDEEGWALFQDKVTEKVVNKQITDFEKHAKDFIKKSNRLPAAIIVIAEALKCIAEREQERDSAINLTLEDALKKAATRLEKPDGSWHSPRFFQKPGRVHYNELIACWILEGNIVGAVDGVVRVEEAYNVGHSVLMKLVDLQMLKMHDDNTISMEELAFTVPDCLGTDLRWDNNVFKKDDWYKGATSSLRWADVFEQLGDWRGGRDGSSLGLASVLEDGDWQGFRRITQMGGMIKTTTSSPERWDKVYTLLIDGRRLYREVADKFFEPMKRLQVLAIFNPTFKSLPKSISEMGELRLLVLRGCDPLENIDPIKDLESLTVLEISGAASLKDIPGDLFQKLSQLRSLKICAPQIKELPPISHMTELRWLILSDCSSLQSLPKIRKLTKLQIVDLSGASELAKLEGRAWKSLENLRRLDVSRTKISRLPILGTLTNLTTLALSRCDHLARLPKLVGLSNLQILDLSGALMLKEIPDESLQHKASLKILDLSQTAIPLFPSNLASLSHLELLDLSGATKLVKLEDKTFEKLSCLRHLDLSKTNIENLPSLSKLDNLEVLNLSGCSALTKIGDQSFDHMTRLQRLQLSETKIEFLPSLSKHVNLRQLLLRSCTSLKQLPSLESQLKLEELDLSGAQLLKETNVDFLKNMNNLQLLNLSGTGLTLPSLSSLTNLTQLSLGGCVLSESEPNFGGHTKLEVLDLSEITKITSLASLANLTSLRELKLRGCSGLKELPDLKSGELPDLKSTIHLEVLDLWGTGIKAFPYVISELTSLKHVDLPDMKDVQNLDWGKINRLPEEVNWVECGILKHCKNGPCISMSATQLSEILKEQANLDKFHISVSAPLKEEGGARDIDWHRIDPSLRNIYLQKFSVPEDHGGFLEIVGFDRFPDGIEGGIVKAEYIALIRNKFMKSLSDLAAKAIKEGVSVSVTAMKGCTLEKCTEMETIFGGEEREVKMRGNLETLRASNLPKLKNVVSNGKEKVGGFEKLRELYMDCCPLLEVVFPSSQLPENLEILEIKFCDKLKTLFGSEAATEYKLQKLKKLHLVELPELTSIGVPRSTIFLSLELVKFRKCPKLMNNLNELLECGAGFKIEQY
ncbi:putative disease resistance protein At4g19050 [Corylus avellana]|uniref:putative disease resistance protein At4g19050 n=1 Tax=Corylus avellana TaxID=13451 RepID=UPI00286CA166|nr:putative disease resistance protein At4g19050 [Corylus avellana]